MANDFEGSVIMRIGIHYITALLTAGVVGVAIAAAPSAAAAPAQQPCTDLGGATQCQRTGNVEIYTAPQNMPVTSKTVYGPFEGYHAGHQ
jgi:hypothetical protein